MSDWRADIDKALKDFVTVASLAPAPVELGDLQAEYLEAPHKPPPTFADWQDGSLWLLA